MARIFYNGQIGIAPMKKYYTHPLFGELLSFWKVSDTEIETEWTNAPLITFSCEKGESPNETMFESPVASGNGYLSYKFNGKSIYFKEVFMADGRHYDGGSPLAFIPPSVFTPVAMGVGK